MLLKYLIPTMTTQNSYKALDYINFVHITATNIYIADMGQMTYSSDKYPLIGTFGVGPCVAIIFYNKSAQKAALAHVSPIQIINPLFNYGRELKLKYGMLYVSHISPFEKTISSMLHLSKYDYTKKNVEIFLYSCDKANLQTVYNYVKQFGRVTVTVMPKTFGVLIDACTCDIVFSSDLSTHYRKQTNNYIEDINIVNESVSIAEHD